MYNLEKQIIDYVNYLNNDLGLCVTVHAGTKVMYNSKVISSCNIHNIPYCQYIKTSPYAWQRCIENQAKVFEKLKDGDFFGICCMGVGEYVYPIYMETDVVGFVSVSGYKTDDNLSLKKIKRASDKYRLNFKILRKLYDGCIDKSIENKKRLDTVIIPLSYMISQYITLLSEEATETNLNKIYGAAISYIKKNYSSKIKINDLAERCHCSKSYLIKVFKESSGKTVGQYLQEYRIEKAKSFLETTSVNVSVISSMCGFEDPNYFSTVFKRCTGIKPTEYRQKHGSNSGY